MTDPARSIVDRIAGMLHRGRTTDAASRSGAALLARLQQDYRGVATEFYAYLPDDVRQLFIDDAVYHQKRYLEMLSRPYGSRVLELGSDKPFISHFLRQLHPDSAFETISIDIPYSAYPITRVDIESQRFPFDDNSFSDVIFTEVLEHLFRDPAWAVCEISRVLQSGGRLFLTTPNACGYDVLVNLISQVNPNGRGQFYAAIESGHPHLWTAAECRLILQAHGLQVDSLTTADYYEIPMPEAVRAFLNVNSPQPAMHGQALVIEAHKATHPEQPVYPAELFPEGIPVQLRGALREWAAQQLQPAGGEPAP